MEQKEIDHAIEILNSALNQLDRLRADLIKQSRKEEKTAKKKKTSEPRITEEITKPLEGMSELNRELTIKQCLEKYGQPTEDEHIQSINNIASTNNITLDQLDKCLERIKYANDKEPKNDIRKYTYSCLHKINRA